MISNVEEYWQVELCADGLAMLLSGLPFGHGLDQAHSLSTAAATDVTQYLGIAHGAVLLNNKAHEHSARDVVLLGLPGVMQVVADELVEGFATARELGVILNDEEYLLLLSGGIQFVITFPNPRIQVIAVRLVGALLGIDEAFLGLGVVLSIVQLDTHAAVAVIALRLHGDAGKACKEEE